MADIVPTGIGEVAVIVAPAHVNNQELMRLVDLASNNGGVDS
jgi:hypothetical protein